MRALRFELSWAIIAAGTLCGVEFAVVAAPEPHAADLHDLVVAQQERRSRAAAAPRRELARARAGARGELGELGVVGEGVASELQLPLEAILVEERGTAGAARDVRERGFSAPPAAPRPIGAC